MRRRLGRSRLVGDGGRLLVGGGGCDGGEGVLALGRVGGGRGLTAAAPVLRFLAGGSGSGARPGKGD